MTCTRTCNFCDLYVVVQIGFVGPHNGGLLRTPCWTASGRSASVIDGGFQWHSSATRLLQPFDQEVAASRAGGMAPLITSHSMNAISPKTAG